MIMSKRKEEKNVNEGLVYRLIVQQYKTNELLVHLLRRINKMSIQLDELIAAVAAENTVIDSAIVLLNQLSSLLITYKDDPIRIAALSVEVRAKADSLAAAVVANTPVETP